MDNNTLITSDHPLSKTQRLMLASLLDVIIPSSEDGRMPSAAELDVVAYIREWAPEFLPLLVELFDALDGLCVERGAEDFTALDYAERQPLVEELSRLQPEQFDGLHRHTLSCYYQDDRVLAGLGLEPGPPFPRGNTIEPGDMSLLDPVRERAKFYRE